MLVVEDDADLRELYAAKLSMEGFKVSLAEDGIEGLDKAIHDLPDVILLDVMLPKKDGFTVLKELKEMNKTKKIPVVILSSLGQNFEVKKGKLEGAAAYLVKTDVTPTEIVQKLREVLNNN